MGKTWHPQCSKPMVCSLRTLISSSRSLSFVSGSVRLLWRWGAPSMKVDRERTAIYETPRVFGAWTNNISGFRKSDFEKSTVFGILFGTHFVNLPFLNLRSFVEIWAHFVEICAHFALSQFGMWMSQSKKVRKNKIHSFCGSELAGSKEFPTESSIGIQATSAWTSDEDWLDWDGLPTVPI